jgi:DNA replication protein DnaC
MTTTTTRQEPRQRLQFPSRYWVEIEREARTCDQHGPYTGIRWDMEPKPTGSDVNRYPYLGPWWGNCPACDAEWQREATAREAEIRGGMSVAKAAALARLRQCGIPARFVEASLWNWTHPMDQQRRVWGAVRDYAGKLDLALQYGRSIVMVGATGAGKTHLACGLLRHVIEKGGTGIYTTAIDLVGRITATFGGKGDEAAVVDELCSVDLLVIDEVGRTTDTQFVSTQFFRVLDRRYRDCKPVVLCSNLNTPKMREFLGDAVADRLGEHGGLVLVFDWASQRSNRLPKLALVEDDE